MRVSRLALLAIIPFAAGCAVLTSEQPEGSVSQRLDRGLASLEAGRYDAAFDDLAWVYSHCPGRQAGATARVALSALELDPRNRTGRPDVGAELLAEVIRHGGDAPATRQLAETTFLTSLALGAPHPEAPPAPADAVAGDSAAGAADTVAARPDSVRARMAGAQVAAARAQRPPRLETVEEPVPGCGPVVMAADSAASLPRLLGPSLWMMYSEARRYGDSLAARTDTLATELEAVRAQLTATREELERIRRTLKP